MPKGPRGKKRADDANGIELGFSADLAGSLMAVIAAEAAKLNAGLPAKKQNAAPLNVGASGLGSL